jgi:hypothetical protein
MLIKIIAQMLYHLFQRKKNEAYPMHKIMPFYRLMNNKR